jgi:hypothetical protein
MSTGPGMPSSSMAIRSMRFISWEVNIFMVDLRSSSRF